MTDISAPKSEAPPPFPWPRGLGFVARHAAAIAFSCAAPALAAAIGQPGTLTHSNLLAMTAWGGFHGALLLGRTVLHDDHVPMVQGSIWAPLQMALLCAWLIPFGPSGATPAQLLWAQLSALG
jgi:hypothetical protein